MSVDVIVPAFKTKLGSSPAKMILVLLADAANSSGYCWPSIHFMVDRTELNERTILRILQIFQAMGLLQKKKVIGEDYKTAYQLDLSMLGGDLRDHFKRLHDLAQGKKLTPETPKEDVAETVSSPEPPETVSPCVLQTVPPNPLIGRTITEPSENLFPEPSGSEEPTPPAKPREVPETPWHRIIAEIDRLYELANPGVDCPWNGLAFQRLRRAMNDHPKWDEKVWIQCIRHRFQSDNINEGEPPEDFIPGLKRFVKGPLNEFNRTKKETASAQPNNVAARNSAALGRALERIDSAARGAAQADHGDDY